MNVKPNLGAGSVAIDLRGFPEGAHSWSWGAPGTVLLFEGGTHRVFRDFRVEGTLQRNGLVFRLRGTLTGVLETECDRCLTRFDRPVETDLEVRAVLGEGEVPAEAAGSGEEGEVAPIYLTAQTALDLSDAIREAVLLEIPIKNLCAEDCRGLCLQCGANLNLESCNCRKTPQDQRWSALRELSFPSDDQE
jgi:uncharacterized protein